MLARHSQPDKDRVAELARFHCDTGELRRRIDECPMLPSLRSLGEDLQACMSDPNVNSESIADVVRLDPSLSARVLKLVNSAFFGLAQRVCGIEDAVFYLGLRQVRELALTLPLIDDASSLCAGSASRATWEGFWHHSLGVAVANREILSLVDPVADGERAYIAGLLHNIGLSVQARVFDEVFTHIAGGPLFASAADLAAFEREVIGWDHGQIGGFFLARHQIPGEITEAIEFHTAPRLAPLQRTLAASVQLADTVCRSSEILGAEPLEPPGPRQWMESEGWQVLFGQSDKAQAAERILTRLVERLPALIEALR
jgi:HD-like signal output (HDOD) protein